LLLRRIEDSERELKETTPSAQSVSGGNRRGNWGHNFRSKNLKLPIEWKDQGKQTRILQKKDKKDTQGKQVAQRGRRKKGLEK